MSNWHCFDDRPTLDAALAAHVAQHLDAAIRTHGRASLAVSGGSTPAGMLAALAQQLLPWDRVYITLVDERWVPPEHPDSNERLVRRTLLQGPAASAQFTGLKTPAAEARQGLPQASARLAALPLPFTCVVLGMGTDGHTASWFPQADNLDALLDPASTALLGCCHPVSAAHPRITLTLAAVAAAQAVCLHITGAAKREVLSQARDRKLPVAAITESDAKPINIWWAP